MYFLWVDGICNITHSKQVQEVQWLEAANDNWWSMGKQVFVTEFVTGNADGVYGGDYPTRA